MRCELSRRSKKPIFRDITSTIIQHQKIKGWCYRLFCSPRCGRLCVAPAAARSFAPTRGRGNGVLSQRRWPHTDVAKLFAGAAAALPPASEPKRLQAPEPKPPEPKPNAEAPPEEPERGDLEEVVKAQARRIQELEEQNAVLQRRGWIVGPANSMAERHRPWQEACELGRREDLEVSAAR